MGEMEFSFMLMEMGIRWFQRFYAPPVIITPEQALLVPKE